MSEIPDNVVSVDFRKKSYSDASPYKTTKLTYQFEDGLSFSTDIPELTDAQWKNYLDTLLEDGGTISFDDFED